jgi:hypothetical protein
MSVTIRKLGKDELKVWDEFVNASPQANLFHTAMWNQMISETDQDGSSPEYIVYEKEGVILGGIPLIFSKGKADAPIAGYNGPLFSPVVNYEQPYKTSSGYEICSGLLKNVCSYSNVITIKNHPEIWDVRPFAFLGWNIRTTYTHVLRGNGQNMVWDKFNEALKEKITESQYSITANCTDDHINKYCSFFIRARKTPLFARSKEAELLKSRIQRLLVKGIGKMVLLTGKNGDEIGLVLLLFSIQNSTIYAGKIIHLSKGTISDIIPSLSWNIDQTFGEKFNRLDLGESETMEISTVKDEVGGTLTPFFITGFRKN